MHNPSQSPWLRFPWASAVGIFFMLYLYVPIVILTILSFNANRSATIWTNFTFDWYGKVLANPQILSAAKNSLLIATSATSCSTVIATLAALAMRKPFWGNQMVIGIISLPLLVPEIVTAVAGLLFFASLGWKLGLLSVLAMHIVFCIPFAYLPIRARLEGMNPLLMEAAADLYANNQRAFLRIMLPLLWPGILSGAMLAFVISLDDFVITSFVAGAGSTTLPVYIYTLIRVGISPEVNAISVVMLLVSILFVSLSYLVGKAGRIEVS